MNKQDKPTKHEIGTQCTAYYPFFISDFLLEGVHLNLELFPSQLEKGGKKYSEPANLNQAPQTIQDSDRSMYLACQWIIYSFETMFSLSFSF